LARTFDGTDDLIQNTTQPTTATDNVTLGLWTYYTSTFGDQDVAVSNGDTSANGYGLYVLGSTMEGVIWGLAFAGTSAAVTTNTWEHWVLRRSSGTWQVYKNGSAASGTPVTTNPNTPATRGFHVGDAYSRSTHNLPGRKAEAFIYDRALSTDEILALAKGYSPLFFRRGLKLYWKLLGQHSPEPDEAQGLSGTVTGATAGDHPRIIYPSWCVAGKPAAVGAVPRVWAQYRRRHAG
jgi:hypothetical protein